MSWGRGELRGENQFINMKARIQTIITVLALVGTIKAQSINVTPTGVGIGTATPTQKLDVAGNVAASGNITAGGTLTTGGSVTVGSSLSTVGSLSAGNGVGGPQGNFEIFTYTDANAAPLMSLRSRYDGVGKYGMIRFGDASQTSNYQKGALIYESTTPVGRGRFHIALENTDGSGSVALSDAKVTVLSNGNVGIGSTTPADKLVVAGNLTVTGAISGGSFTGLSGLASAGIYTSPDLVYTNGTVTTIAHGLGKVPKFWTASLRCVSPELNYAVGDEIPVLGDFNDASAYQSSVNATNFYFSVYPVGVRMMNRNGGVPTAALTPANWRLVFRAINL
jgi:hypothetical protein